MSKDLLSIIGLIPGFVTVNGRNWLIDFLLKN
jgi:hypothetical protein